MSLKIIGYKGSGGIAAGCDFGLWLENPVNYDDKENSLNFITLYFRKVRRGPNYKLPLQLTFPGGRFSEASDQWMK